MLFCAIILLEPTLVNWFCRQVFAKKEKYARLQKIGFILLCAITLSENVLQNYIGGINLIVYTINNTYFLVYYFYAKIFFVVDKRVLLGGLSIHYILGALVEYLYSFIMMICLQMFNTTEALQETSVRLVSMFFINLLSGSVLIIFAKMKAEYRNAMQYRNVFQLLMLVLVGDMITFSIFCIASDNAVGDVFNIGTATVLVYEFIMMSYAIYLIIAKHEREYQQKLAVAKNQTAMLYDTRQQLEQSHKAMHDMGNHLCTLKILAESQRNNEVIELLGGLIPELQDAESRVVGTGILNAILYEKRLIAEREQINLLCGLEAEDVQIPIHDLNSIVTNMLDNAIEACKKIKNPKKRRIIFKAYVKEPDLIIECKNTYAEEPKKKPGGNYLSSKEDSTSHGYGIEKIMESAQRNEGDVDVIHQNGEFIVRVLLDSKIAVVRGEKECI